MKKGLIITSTLALLFGVGVAVGAHQEKAAKVEAGSDRDVYLNIIDRSDFLQGNERFAVYAFNGGGNHWYDMTSYNGSDHFFKATIDSDYTSVIFCRMNGSEAENIWDNKWDQTDDLELGVNATYFKATAKIDGAKQMSGEWYDANPSETTNLYYVYDKEQALGETLANIKVYGFGNDLIIPNVWPGTHDGVTSVTEGGRSVYRVELSESYTKLIMNNGTVQTVDVEDIADHIGDVLKIGAVDGEGKYTVSWEELSEFNDHPNADGYYVLGTETTWKFAGATLVPAVVKDAHNNVAILSDYSAKLNEQIRIRSYFNEAKEWLTCVTDSIEGIGAKVGDNFVFSKAADVDIYVYDDNGTIKFSVAEHVELVTVSIKNRFFTGATFTNTTDAPNQDCVKGAEFTPSAQGAVDGYVARGYYTNEACTTAFTNGTVLNENTTLYAKYTKVGYYTISEAGSWSIDTAVAMNVEGIGAGNKAEAAITVAAVNEKYSFVYYNAEGTMEGHSGLGAEYDYVENDETNIKFTKTGTYTVYWSNTDNKLYVNGGLDAFYSNFLADLGGVCNSQGQYATEEAYNAVKAAWGRQKTAFQNLTTDQQKVIKDVTFDGGSDADDLHRVVLKYHYIVYKYGTSEFEDFIWNQSVDAHMSYSTATFETTNVNNSGAIAIIVIAATVMTISVGVFFILKRKHN